MKTKKAMKKITHIGMAALVAMGMLGTSCNKAESPEIETPETQKENIVTLTTTVGFAADDTKALTGTGVKTFGAGDQMAVIYKNTSGGTVKAVGTLTSGAGTKSGTFTFTLTNPDKTQNVTYIYPAAMAGTSDVDYTKLNSQSGCTLTDLGSKYDLATNSGAWNGDNLPTLTLENQLAILAISLKNTTDITSTIKGMTISDGTNTYAVSRSAAAGPIYVAIRPTSDATITVTATDGTNDYAKTLTTTKTYAANNGYNVTWNMTKLEKVVWNSTNVFNSSNENVSISNSNKTATFEGVTVSFTGSGGASFFELYETIMMVEPTTQLFVNGGQGGAFTFTAPSGKIFTKIEIINSRAVTFTPYGDWTKPANNKIMWSGTASSTVTLASSSNINCPKVTSIVFTMMNE